MEEQHIGLKPLSELDARMLSPLKLAYLGDAVLDLFVRDYVIKKDLGTVNKLHSTTIKIVNAKAQAEFAKNIETELTEQEIAIFKRGRNAKSGIQPKNASMSDYRFATALESLIGYLYVCGANDRLKHIITKLYEVHFTDI